MTSNNYYFLQHYSLHNCKEKHIIAPMHQGEEKDLFGVKILGGSLYEFSK